MNSKLCISYEFQNIEYAHLYTSHNRYYHHFKTAQIKTETNSTAVQNELSDNNELKSEYMTLHSSTNLEQLIFPCMKCLAYQQWKNEQLDHFALIGDFTLTFFNVSGESAKSLISFFLSSLYSSAIPSIPSNTPATDSPGGGAILHCLSLPWHQNHLRLEHTAPCCCGYSI